MIKLIKKLLEAKPLFFIALIYTAIITLGSLVNPTTLPKIDPNISDKTIHILAYCFLTILWAFYGLYKYSETLFKRVLLVVSFLAFIYGIIIELLQSKLTISRQADFYDILANALGIILAVLVLIYFQKKIKKLKSLF